MPPGSWPPTASNSHPRAWREPARQKHLMCQGDCHCASQKPFCQGPVSAHVLGQLAWLPVSISLSHLESLPCVQPFGELGKILYGKVQTWRLINTGHTMQSRRHRCLGDRPLLAGDSWGHDGKAVLHLRPRCRYKSTWNILQIASVVFAQLVSTPPFSRSPGFFWGIYCLSILGLCVPCMKSQV